MPQLYNKLVIALNSAKMKCLDGVPAACVLSAPSRWGQSKHSCLGGVAPEGGLKGGVGFYHFDIFKI